MEISQLRGIDAIIDGTPRSKRSAEDSLMAENQSISLPSVKRSRVEEGSLCKVCQQVDFVGIFDGSRKGRQNLPTVRQALCNADCLLCQLVISSLKDFLQLEETSQKFDIYRDASDILANAPSALEFDLRASLKWRSTPPDLYLKRKHVSCARQACICLRETEASRSHGRRQRRQVILSCLDSTTFRRVFKSLEQRCAMVRRSIPERFDPGTLRGWLGQTIGPSEASRKQSTMSRRESQSDPQQSGHFRLLHVHSGQIIVPEKEEKYVALSYVWGTDMATYIQQRAGTDYEHLSMENLPLTIRDAASLVASIGEQYLWVDAICIKQNDAEDPHANIAHMGSIYRQALLTIVATEGEGANAGLSRLRCSGRIPECPVSLDTARGTVSLLPSRWPLEEVLDSTNWSTRGWTMQERLLSKTCVFFTTDEVLFTSGNFEAREAYEIIEVTSRSDQNDRRSTRLSRRSRRDFDRLLSDPGADWKLYETTVRKFTAKKLSYEGDRLDAFMGILSSMHPRVIAQGHIIALAGFHYGFFYSCLLWNFAPGNMPTRIEMNTRNTRRLPSWSWAGWRGVCKFPDDYDEPFGSVDILDAANIRLNYLPSEGPGYLPENARIPVSRPLRTVLHIRAYAADCKLIPRDINRPVAGFDIEIQLPDSRPVYADFGPSDSEFAQIAAPSVGGKHRVIALGYFPTYGEMGAMDFVDTVLILLVEARGNFFERLGLWRPSR